MNKGGNKTVSSHSLNNPFPQSHTGCKCQVHHFLSEFKNFPSPVEKLSCAGYTLHIEQPDDDKSDIYSWESV